MPQTGSRRIVRFAGAATLALAALATAPGVAVAACTQIGTNQTCTNTGVLGNATAPGITDTGTLTLTNTASGVIGTTFANDGINAQAITLTNAGSITGSTAVNSNSFATVTNAGVITGQLLGVSAQDNATVNNTGTINSAGGFAGVLSNHGSVTVTNSGGIAGLQIGVGAQLSVTVVNSGSITAQNYGVYSSGGDLILTNSGIISSSPSGGAGVIEFSGSVTASNSGTITGGQYGVAALTNLVLTNSGSISGGSVGVFNQSGQAFITNTGRITGPDFAIGVNGLALTNGGTIAAGNVGIEYLGGTVANSGVITAGQVGLLALGPTGVFNSGVISSPGLALLLGGGNSSLTLLPGSTIIGAIEIDGPGNAVHVNAPNQNLTFTTLAGSSVDGTMPFVVSGNRIASVDPTQFAATDRNLLAVIDTIAGVMDGRTGSPSGAGALGFNGPSTTAATAEEAFADLFGYARTPNDAVLFKNPSVTFGEGSMVWAKGFIGQRVQEGDGLVLRNVTNFYGGMVGVDGWLAPDLKLGALAGAGHTATGIDLNAGSSASDLGFGGVYGRKELGRAFVDFDVIAGGSSNSTTRTINNNLLASGLETATGSFGGWFVSPEIAVGYRHEVWPGFTLTPAARLRYLAAGFAGYTESGSTADLTMGSRLAQAMEERVEATLAHVNDVDGWGQLRLAATIGLVGQERVGSTALNAVLLGQALAFATPGRPSIGGLYLAGNADWNTPFGATLFAGADYTTYSDASTIVTGRAGVKVGF